jgi:hypothetical protein
MGRRSRPLATWWCVAHWCVVILFCMSIRSLEFKLLVAAHCSRSSGYFSLVSTECWSIRGCLNIPIVIVNILQMGVEIHWEGKMALRIGSTSFLRIDDKHLVHNSLAKRSFVTFMLLTFIRGVADLKTL